LEVGTPLHVFHHLPRCGGTAAKTGLRQWFRLRRDYRDFDPAAGVSCYPEPFDWRKLGSHDLLCGHWELPGYSIAERYPGLLEHPGLRLITFVRNPLERVVSSYFYELAHWGPAYAGDLDARVAGSQDVMARLLGVRRPGEERALDRFWFVGLTEHLQESFDILAAMLGKPRVALERHNEAPRSGSRPSPAAIEAFRSGNLDLLIHERACRRFEEHRRWLRAGPGA
jgi:hypothetical protein